MSDGPVSAAPTPRELVDGVSRELEAGGVESPGLEAERLVSLALGVERHELVSRGDAAVDPRRLRPLGRLVRRRLEGEPLQYIEGTAPFRDLLLVADGRALVPRPETEQLVDVVREWVASRSREGAGSGGVRVVRRRVRKRVRDLEPVARALDIGTGSGAIALSLVHEEIARSAVGLDVSAEALAQAAENRSRCGLDDAVELRLAEPSIWESLGPDERFEVIVSNPPYVRDDELAGLPRDVREHEPAVALRGGSDGLDVVRRVTEGAPDHLTPDGALFLEIGSEQAADVRSLLVRGPWRDVKVHRDDAGRERFVVACRA